MNTYNLAVVFTPCLLRSEKATMADLLNAGSMANIV